MTSWMAWMADLDERLSVVPSLLNTLFVLFKKPILTKPPPTTTDSPGMQPKQAFRCRSSGKPANIPTFVDPKTGELVVLWKDIQRAFKNAESIWKGGDMLPFLKDQSLEEIIPLRVAHHPDDVLEVDVEDVSQVHYDRDTAASTHSEIFPGDGIAETNTINQALSGCSTSMIQTAHSTVIAHNQPLNPGFRVLMSGQANLMFGQAAMKQSMDHHFDRIQAENKELREQLFQMQAKLDEKQAKLDEKQDQMLQMQQQALDRLAIIQSSVLALATQTYELHEYPIP
ncbi:hypothetical protein BGX34_010468, partial [Mortierella sp. NVP85]